jgi:hypothetical protein
MKVGTTDIYSCSFASLSGTFYDSSYPTCYVADFYRQQKDLRSST